MFYQPLSAAPQYAPMGWVGDQVQHYAPVIGSAVGGITTQLTKSPAIGGIAGGLIGGALGNKGLGSAIGSGVGAFLPFQAGPNGPITYVPVQQAVAQPEAAQQVVYH